MSNGENSAAGECSLDGALNHVVGLHVHRGRRLIQQQNLIPAHPGIFDVLLLGRPLNLHLHTVGFL